MVCDEVTSGLDPTSEDHILALLRNLVQEQDKTFLCIIHNLAKLDQFDSITVVHHGNVIFQGHLEALLEYFGIDDACSSMVSCTHSLWNTGRTFGQNTVQQRK